MFCACGDRLLSKNMGRHSQMRKEKAGDRQWASSMAAFPNQPGFHYSQQAGSGSGVRLLPGMAGGHGEPGGLPQLTNPQQSTPASCQLRLPRAARRAWLGRGRQGAPRQFFPVCGGGGTPTSPPKHGQTQPASPQTASVCKHDIIQASSETAGSFIET